MAESEFDEEGDQPSGDGEPRRGIGSAASGTLSALLDYLESRLQLFLLEARHSRSVLVRRIIAVAVGAFFLVTAYLTLLAGGIGLVSGYFGWPWPLVALAAGGSQLALGAILILMAKARSRRTAFEESLNEFKKDREWLRDLGSRK